MERLSTTQKKTKVLHQLRLTRCTVEKACESAIVSTSQFYVWIKKDNEFKVQYINILNTTKEFCMNTRLKKIYKSNSRELAKLARQVDNKISRFV
jgi:hypothetical protein